MKRLWVFMLLTLCAGSVLGEGYYIYSPTWWSSVNTTVLGQCWYCEKDIVTVKKDEKVVYEETLVKFEGRDLHKECLDTFLDRMKRAALEMKDPEPAYLHCIKLSTASIIMDGSGEMK